MNNFEERNFRKKTVDCPVCGGILEKAEGVWKCPDCFARFELTLKKIEKPVREAKPYVRFNESLFARCDEEQCVCDEETERIKKAVAYVLDAHEVQGGEIRSVKRGPTVTQYNVFFPFYVDLKKITELELSFTVAIRKGQVRVYLNYEEGCVTVEVPNKERSFTLLGNMLSEQPYAQAPQSALLFALGKNMSGKPVYGDISRMIHMLVAGSSGSGKSVFIHSMLVSLLYKYSPEELRLILIDPKRVEFDAYNGLPHMLTEKFIYEPSQALRALDWAIEEMNRRYRLFTSYGEKEGFPIVNVDEYNKKAKAGERLPKILIVIDELADLLLCGKKKLEDRIQTLAIKARPAGIHLVLATQRPSADVVTGVLRSVIPTRIAFTVSSESDSRRILECDGAQKLLGRGDMLYTALGVSAPIRAQCAYVSDAEIRRAVEFIKENNEACYDERVIEFISAEEE